MTIDRITTAGGTSEAPSATGAGSIGQDAFLKLLLTQLQYQDPTAPQADGEFLAQLAQFSTLEQLQEMNATLDLIARNLIVTSGNAATEVS